MHFPDLDVRHFWRAHLGFQSEHQTRFRETLPTHFPVDQGGRFETSHPIPTVESLGRILPEEEGCIPPGVSIRGPFLLAEGSDKYQY